MDIGIIGVGKLGSCLALTLDSKGFSVIGCDINETYLEALEKKTFKSSEPSFNEYLANSCVNWTSDKMKTIARSRIIFITVKTEELSSGEYDVSQVDSVMDEILQYDLANKIFVINCNVNPGYTEIWKSKIEEKGAQLAFNPEWVAQGTIIKDQLKPENVVIGSYHDFVAEELEDLYKDLCDNSPSVFRMSPAEAEIVKLGVNSFLAVKIAYCNMIGDMACATHCDPDVILKAIGSDSRVGRKYFRYGFGFGGPCLPRDINALAAFSETLSMNFELPKCVSADNKYHRTNYAEYLSADPDYIFETLSYKPGVDIYEFSEQLETAKVMFRNGVEVRVNGKSADEISKLLSS